MSHTSSVLLLASELYGIHGGVQTYTRRLAEIISEYNVSRDGFLDCVSLQDRSPAGRHSRPAEYRSFIGTRGNKLKFMLQSLRLAAKYRHVTAVVAHPGMAPVALALHRASLIRSYTIVLHGIEAWCKVSRLDRAAAAGATRLVSTTEYTAQEYCRANGLSLKKCSVIPLALGEDSVDPVTPAYRAPGHALEMLTVCRLSSADGYKGVDSLIEVVHRLRERSLAVNLTVVGQGDELPQLQRQADALGVTQQVRFLGAVSDAELERSYRECDIFAMPSKGEGFGIVFLEAMRFGKPCIGGRHGGTPEVISHGEDGYLVEYGDVNRLSEYLIESATRPDLRREMGIRAFRKLQEKYLYPRMRAQWFRLLDEMRAARSTFEEPLARSAGSTMQAI